MQAGHCLFGVNPLRSVRHQNDSHLVKRLFFQKTHRFGDGGVNIRSPTCRDNLRKVCNELFGEENFVAQFVWNTEGHTDNQFDVKVNHEYVTLYAKNSGVASLGHTVDPNIREESNLWKGFAENSITKNGPANPPTEVTLPGGLPVFRDYAASAGDRSSPRFF